MADEPKEKVVLFTKTLVPAGPSKGRTYDVLKTFDFPSFEERHYLPAGMVPGGVTLRCVYYYEK